MPVISGRSLTDKASDPTKPRCERKPGCARRNAIDGHQMQRTARHNPLQSKGLRKSNGRLESWMVVAAPCRLAILGIAREPVSELYAL